MRIVMCEVVGSICVITCSVSLATVATISFNRFLFVCYNPLHDRIFTKKRCGVMVLCLWLYGGVVDLPLHFGWGRHGYDLKTMGCTYDRTHTYGYTLYLIVMIVILPLLTVAYSYTNVYMFVRNSRKRLAGALNEAKVKQDDLKDNTSKQFTNQAEQGDGSVVVAVLSGPFVLEKGHQLCIFQILWDVTFMPT
ncbi:melatonin receptor [Branchiostoma belcheri]|nr:melatonin receptor [Branchiostoma belcheri]